MNCEKCGVLMAVGCDEAETNVKAASHQLWKHPTPYQFLTTLLEFFEMSDEFKLRDWENADDLDYYFFINNMFNTLQLLQAWAKQDAGL